MSPDDYENLVADIVTGIQAAAPELQGYSLGHGRTNRLAGASCYRHQIDVSLESSTSLYVLECKRWRVKVGLREVLVLLARAADICEHRPTCLVIPILVSQCGATKGAKEVARHFNIQLEVVSSAHDFGLALGHQALVAVSAGMHFRDEATAQTVRGGDGASG